MKHIKIVSIASALVLSAAPFTVNAFTAENALNNCAAALTEEMSGGSLGFKIGDDSYAGGHLANIEVFHLDARDPKTNEVVARADCVVDSRARVRRLNTLPLDAGDAKERSLTAY